MTGHHVETALMVYLRWNGAEWEVDPITDQYSVKGEALALDLWNTGISNTECEHAAEDPPGSDVECAKELAAAEAARIPTTRVLLDLLVRHFYPHDLPADITDREEVEKWLRDNR